MLLEELQELWRRKKYSYLKKKRICDFGKPEGEGLAHIKTKAIDFDPATKKIHEHCTKSNCFCLGKGKGVSSCDALDIVITDNKMNLIEFTGLSGKQDKKKKNRKNPKQDLKHESKSKKLKKKFEDSLKTIHKLVNGFRPESMDELENYEKQLIISLKLHEIPVKKQLLYLESTIIKNIELEGFNDKVKILKTDNFDQGYANLVKRS